MEQMNLGPCCICEAPDAENIMTLDFKNPPEVQGAGWGCFQCGLALEGANSCFL